MTESFGFTQPEFPFAVPEKREMVLEIILSRQEAAQGGSLPVSIPVPASCPTCQRRGNIHPFCPRCRGKGRVILRQGIRLRLPPNVRQGRHLYRGLEEAGIKGVVLTLDIRVNPFM